MQKINIRNTIGYHIRAEDFSKEFQKALDTGEKIEIHLNSPGGSVYHGWEMYNEIKMAVSNGADIDMYNISMAASIASVIYLSVPKSNRYMAETSLYMIHNPSGIAFGDAKEMDKEKRLLEKIEDISANLYAKEAGKPAQYMKAKMDKTIWYKPSEAKNEGFVGTIVDGYDDVEEVQVVGMEESAFEGMPSNCTTSLCFESKGANIKSEKAITDLTKITNSQIREKTWKNCMKS